MNSVDLRIPGTSFNSAILTPQMPVTLMRACWESYDRAGDGFLRKEEFEDLSRRGHIVNLSIYDDDWCYAIFGLELMHSLRGPYTSFLYFDLWHGKLTPIARAVIITCHSIALHWHRFGGGGDEPARMLLKGRHGWRRMLQRLGIKIDEKGWITEAQKAFTHGIQ